MSTEFWNQGIWNYGIMELWNAAPPGTYFGTLRSVGLRKTTDVLEFSSTLMEQRTLDARGVLCRHDLRNLSKNFFRLKSSHCKLLRF